MTTILLPEANRKNLEEIPKALRKDLNLEFVADIREVFRIAFREPLALAGGLASDKRPGKTLAASTHSLILPSRRLIDSGLRSADLGLDDGRRPPVPGAGPRLPEAESRGCGTTRT